MTTRRTTGFLGLLLATAATAAQEPKPPAASTAQAGEVVPASFRAFIVIDARFPLRPNSGAKGDPAPPSMVPSCSHDAKNTAPRADDRDPRDRTGKVHDLVSENGLSPTVAVFVRADAKTLGADSGVAKLAKSLEQKIPDYRADRLGGFVVFLKLEGPPKTVTLAAPDSAVVELDAEYPDDEKRQVYAAEICDLAKAAAAPNVPFALAPVTSKAATAWALGADDQVTVVIYNRLRVINRWKFDATGPTDEQIKEIIAATEEMITGVKKKAKTD